MTEVRELTDVHVRELADVDAMREAEALLAVIWQTTAERPPLSADVLRALSHAGCYVAGAYDGDRLVGASAGFLGGSKGDLHLHSHITGVLPEAQGRRVGYELKLHQRSWCLERGVGVVTWTFDPLVRRNAWFNLHRLGAEVAEFHRDFYGEMSDGLNAGDHSDRFYVRWRLETAGERPPIVPTGDDRVVALPDDIERLRRDDPAAARACRSALRDALAAALDDGFSVAGMSGQREYVLTRREGVGRPA